MIRCNGWNACSVVTFSSITVCVTIFGLQKHLIWWGPDSHLTPVNLCTRENLENKEIMQTRIVSMHRFPHICIFNRSYLFDAFVHERTSFTTKIETCEYELVHINLHEAFIFYVRFFTKIYDHPRSYDLVFLLRALSHVKILNEGKLKLLPSARSHYSSNI